MVAMTSGGSIMATCPKCHTWGATWKHCKACDTFWCANCKLKEGVNIMNKCPYCDVVGQVETKEPR